MSLTLAHDLARRPRWMTRGAALWALRSIEGKDEISVAARRDCKMDRVQAAVPASFSTAVSGRNQARLTRVQMHVT